MYAKVVNILLMWHPCLPFYGKKMRTGLLSQYENPSIGIAGPVAAYFCTDVTGIVGRRMEGFPEQVGIVPVDEACFAGMSLPCDDLSVGFDRYFFYFQFIGSPCVLEYHAS